MGNSETQADPAKVALRKESVDRNHNPDAHNQKTSLSLSARRAWIEMRAKFGTFLPMYRMSLSARRAWIEMTKQLNGAPPLTSSRSPQGERG